MASKEEANDILTQLKSGNREVINGIYRDVFPKVNRYILGHGGLKEDALDVFQETLETILLKIDHVQSSFEGLVMQICKHKWIDRIRKTSRDRVRNEDATRLTNETPNPDDEIIKKEQEYLKYKIMDHAFQQLSEKCREMLTLIQAGKKVEEIVVSMAFSSANTMYRRKAACIERWSELIKNSNGYNTLYE